jgi:hypothetical protein
MSDVKNPADGGMPIPPGECLAPYCDCEPGWCRQRAPATFYRADVVPPSDDARDAARYRWLRQQHWDEAPLCVVMRPREAVKLGHDCPALDRLDAAIDQAMGTDGVKEVPAGYERMRGGKPVAYWRDNALEAAAQIAEAYHSHPGVASDIRAMKSTSGVTVTRHETFSQKTPTGGAP